MTQSVYDSSVWGKRHLDDAVEREREHAQAGERVEGAVLDDGDGVVVQVEQLQRRVAREGAGRHLADAVHPRRRAARRAQRHQRRQRRHLQQQPLPQAGRPAPARHRQAAPTAATPCNAMLRLREIESIPKTSKNLLAITHLQLRICRSSHIATIKSPSLPFSGGKGGRHLGHCFGTAAARPIAVSVSSDRECQAESVGDPGQWCSFQVAKGKSCVIDHGGCYCEISRAASANFKEYKVHEFLQIYFPDECVDI
ncbi:Protein of unknown function [Gryllus bimaculatus]|nr:Protein of unknown function [Gryllus bimaculatus]